MELFYQKILTWNTKYNRLPYKVLLSLIVVVTFFLLVALFPYIWPFVLGLVFATIIEPLVRLLRKVLKKIPLGKSISTIVGMVLLFGILSAIMVFFLGRIFTELKIFANELPAFARFLSEQIELLIHNLSIDANGVVSEDTLAFIRNIANEVGKNLVSIAATLSKAIASGAWTTATSFPMVLLSVLFSIISTFYFSSQKEGILSFLHQLFPSQTVANTQKLKDNIIKALFSQIKSQLLISALLTVFLIIGLVLIGVSYPHLMGLLIGVADALPIIGAGLFLIPWSLFGFITGNTSLGIGMAILYVSVGVFRQIIEPKIVGKNLGLHPLATMMSIFVGFKLTGSFLGMLAGPILLNICKVILALDEENYQKNQAISSKPSTQEESLPPPLL